MSKALARRPADLPATGITALQNLRGRRSLPQALKPPLRPEPSPAPLNPSPPPGPQWGADRGAIPGEPMYFIGRIIDDARAVIIPREISGTGLLFDAILADRTLLGTYDNLRDAAAAAEFVTRRTLIFIPCGARKIWHQTFLAGPTPAKDAYTSTTFKLHRKYAERFGTYWRILSAWYGITDPDQLVEDYDARFSSVDLKPQNWWRLEGMFRQARALPAADHVILLGGCIYRQIARRILQGIFLPSQIEEPFAGMDLLRSNHAIRLALTSDS